jgi:hypothetical protein
MSGQTGGTPVPTIGKQFIHGGGFLFALATANVGADGLSGNILGGAMQPAGQHRAAGEFSCLFRQGNKRGLRHVFGEVCIAHHAQGGGVNEVKVAPHQFTKGWLGLLLGVGQQ